MKRNLVLVLVILIIVPIIFNGVKRLSSFRGTSQKVDEAQTQLNELKKENEGLRRELQYKSSDSFAEEEIRNKLGMVKQGETEVIITKPEVRKTDSGSQQEDVPNWQKWRDLLLGRSS